MLGRNGVHFLFKNNMSSTKNFPILQNDRILKVCRGEETDVIPVWVMRQAGRYLPEFQAIRKKYDFFEICRTPELACEVTLMPIRRFNLDAAIIFSDILVIPQALGMEVLMVAGTGPVLTCPLNVPEDFNRLNTEGVIGRLKYVGEAITMTRHALQGKVPLFGFSGAPWTLMGYMIEGGGSKTMMKTKKWLYKYPKESHNLLTILTDIIVDYLIMQAQAGAQLLQVFDSSAEYLNAQLYEQFALPYLKHIRTSVKNKLRALSMTDVPMILFAKGAHFCLPAQAELGYDVIGIDWTVDPVAARRLVGPDVVLQGNLDPPALYASEESLRNMTNAMLKRFGKGKYIANLGHGIYPDAPIESVEIFIDEVHKFKH